MSDRDEFEKWAKASGYALLKTGLNQYFYTDTAAAWDAWQVARQGGEVEPDFKSIEGKRMGELSPEETDLAYEKWLREQIEWFDGYHRTQIESLLRQIDRLRANPPAPTQGEPDWSDSKTLDSEGWKNPLLAKNDRLQIADGAVAWRDEVIRNLRSQKAPTQGVPEGWKLVPLTPTESMQQAWDLAPTYECGDQEFISAYQAMLGAAPQPPQEGE